jgi:hypothetical protein
MWRRIKLLLILGSFLLASDYDNIPLGSLNYEAWDYFRTAGYIITIPPTSKPYSQRFSKIFFQEKLASTRLNTQGLFYKERVKYPPQNQTIKFKTTPATIHFAPMVKLDYNNFKDYYTPLGFMVYPQNQVAYLGFRFFLDTLSKISFYHFSEVVFRRRYEADTLDPAGRHYPNTRYKSYQNFFAFETRQAYMRIPFSILTLQVGRDYLYLGPGYRSSVILANHLPSFDQIQLGVQEKDYSVLWFVAGLSRWDSYHRFLSGQRGEINITKHFRLGGTMLVVYSPDSLQTKNFLGYLNPLIPLYLEKSITGDDDNVLMALDFIWYLRTLKLYSAIMLDNFEFNRRTDRPPNCYCLTVGYYFPYHNCALRGEYSKITRYTYYHRIYHIAYTHYSVPIGHALGPDADELFLQGEYYPNSKLQILAQLSIIRRGDGNRGNLDNRSWEAGELVIREFPSGDVERRRLLGITVNYYPSSIFKISAGIYYDSRQDFVGHLSVIYN